MASVLPSHQLWRKLGLYVGMSFAPTAVECNMVVTLLCNSSYNISLRTDELTFALGSKCIFGAVAPNFGGSRADDDRKDSSGFAPAVVTFPLGYTCMLVTETLQKASVSQDRSL